MMPYNLTREPFNFVHELSDELMCIICLDVALDPMQHEQCKKLLCEDCKKRYGVNRPCPNCRGEGAKFLPHEESKQ
jgi:hypothetical protein